MSREHLTHPKTCLFLLESVKNVCFLIVILVTPLWNLRGLGRNSCLHFGSLRYWERDQEQGSIYRISYLFKHPGYVTDFFLYDSNPVKRETWQMPHSILSRKGTSVNSPLRLWGGPFLLVKKMWTLKMPSDWCLLINSDVS